MVLVSRLRPALVKLNPSLPSVTIELAIAELTRERATLLPVAANQDVYKLIKDGVTVKFKDDEGRQREETVRVMDWEHPKENDFLLVSQLWVTGNIYTRRTDLLGFVNGLPLVFIELKASHKQLAHAYRDNLRDYKETIPISSGTTPSSSSPTAPPRGWAVSAQSGNTSTSGNESTPRAKEASSRSIRYCAACAKNPACSISSRTSCSTPKT